MGQLCRPALAVVASVFGAALAAQGCGGGGGGGGGGGVAPPPATTPTVSFATRSSVVGSESGAVTIEVVLTLPTTQTSLPTALTAQVVVSGGSASSGDFTGAPTTITFRAGSVSGERRAFQLRGADDAVVEGVELVDLRLVAGSGARAGSPSAHQVSLLDDDAPVISFLVANGSATEGATHDVVLTLGGDTAVPVTVTLAASGGSAAAGLDYVDPGVQVTFPAGSAQGATETLTVSLEDDDLVEGEETILLGLSGAAAAGTTTHTVTVQDADAATVVFALASSALTEGSTTHPVLVTLTTSPSTATLTAAAAVRLDSADGTATAGADFTAVVGRILVFAAGAGDGAAPAPSADVNVLTDDVGESDEAFTLQLSAPTGALALGATTAHSVTITDDDLRASDDAYATGAGLKLAVSAAGALLANDVLRAPPATVVSFGGGSLGGSASAHAAGAYVVGAGGGIRVRPDGSLLFEPAAGFSGTFTFQYRLSNGVLADADGTVTIEVQSADVTALAVVGAPDVAGRIQVDYALQQPQSLRADVTFEFDPDGAGPLPLRSCTEASGNAEGRWGLTTSPGGTAHAFLWNSAADLPEGAAGVELRVRASVGGAHGVMRSLTGLNVRTRQPAFRATPSVGTLDAPAGVATGDVDRDGDDDIVAALAGSGGLRVLLNDGAGALTSHAAGSVSLPPALDVALADVNRDGILDALVVSASDGVFVAIGDGGGGWSVVDAFASGPFSSSAAGLAWGDLDRDGDVDVVVGDAVDPCFHVLMNPGDGRFIGLSTFAAASGASLDVAVGDLDRDGFPDVVCFDGPGDLITFQGGLDPWGDHTFVAGAVSPSTAPGATRRFVTLADVDGDGDLDALTADDASADVDLLLGDGTLGLAPASVLSTAGAPLSDPALGDLDGDGWLDLITGGATTSLSVRLADGAGGFGARVDLPLATSAGLTPIVADQDRDGRLDLVTALTGDATILPLLNDLPGRIDASFGGVELVELDFPGNATAWKAIVADWNSDGRPDLAAADAWDGVHVFLGRAGGGFTAAGEVGGLIPWALRAGDMNLDGHLDLVAIRSASLGSTVYVLLNDGAGQFTPAPGAPFNTSPTGGVPRALALADVDDDGDLDVAVAHWATSSWEVTSLRILLNDGVGSLSLGASLTTGIDRATAIDAGDLDHDGDVDLVVANDADGTTSSISVLLNDGSGAYAPSGGSPFTPPGGVLRPTWLALSDVGGDGHLDLTVTYGASSHVALLVGDGLGGFTPTAQSPLTLPAGSSPQGLAFADLDVDGRSDLVVALGGTTTFPGTPPGIAVYLATGSGAFAAPTTFSPDPGLPRSVALADVTGDGRLDAIVAMGGNATLGVFRGDGAGALEVVSSAQHGVSADALDVLVADVAAPGGAPPDGRADLVVRFDDRVRLFHGDGAGAFSLASGFFGSVFNDVAVADCANTLSTTADGRPDLVVAGGNGARLNLGADFMQAVSAADGARTNARQVAAGDLDRLGGLDVVVAYRNGDARVFTSSEASTFALGALFNVGGIPGDLALADADRDGDLDVVAAVTFIDPVTLVPTSSVRVFLNDGDGAVSAHPGNPFVTPNGLQSLVVTDVDRDGVADVVVGCIAVTSAGGGPVLLLRGTGVDASWTLSAATPIAMVYHPSGIVRAGDVTGDGIVDLVTNDGGGFTDATRSAAVVMVGDGSGAFPTRRLFAVAGFATGTAFGDLDRDGRVDLVTSSGLFSPSVTVHLGR